MRIRAWSRSLKRTLGVPLFQEQLLRVAMICAGFFRRRGGRVAARVWFQTSEARMKEIEVKLRQGLAQNGITGKDAG